METDEDIYHAKPQTRGRNAHQTVDEKRVSSDSNSLESLPVLSSELGIYGRIDVYKKDSKSLFERKYELKKIYRGQLYQLWAQFFCLESMGYSVEKIAFYEISTHKTFYQTLPSKRDKAELAQMINALKNYNPNDDFNTNHEKCSHCVYCNLCDKTLTDNVYS